MHCKTSGHCRAMYERHHSRKALTSSSAAVADTHGQDEAVSAQSWRSLSVLHEVECKESQSCCKCAQSRGRVCCCKRLPYETRPSE